MLIGNQAVHPAFHAELSRTVLLSHGLAGPGAYLDALMLTSIGLILTYVNWTCLKTML